MENSLTEYWEVLANGTTNEKVAKARAILSTVGVSNADVSYSALCVLLNNGNCAEEVIELLEHALLKNFDGLYKRLLPLLGHAYQRNYDYLNAYLFLSVCDRIGILHGQNAWANSEKKSVVSGLAEHLFFRDFDKNGEASAGVRTRALYELLFTLTRPDEEVIASAESPSISLGQDPDFIIVGSAKCGTTYLYDLITRSEHVWARDPKEIHFFTDLYAFGSDFYRRFFSFCPKGLLCGEASPDYFDINNPLLGTGVNIAERIFEIVPKAKLIVILRDPADRAISMYNQLVTNLDGNGPRPGASSLNDLTFDDLESYNNGYILKSGQYCYSLRNFAEKFSSDQLLVLNFDELSELSGLSMKLTNYLGIPPLSFASGGEQRKNKGDHGLPSPELYEQLRSYYSVSLAKLKQEFGVEL